METETHSSVQLTTGTGIALAGVWLGCSAVSVTLIVMLFTQVTWSTGGLDAEAILFVFVVIAFVVWLPMMAARKMSRFLISGKEE